MTIPAGALINWMPDPDVVVDTSWWSDFGFPFAAEGTILDLSVSTDEALNGSTSLRAAPLANNSFGAETVPATLFGLPTFTGYCALFGLNFTDSLFAAATLALGDTVTFIASVKASSHYVGKQATLVSLGGDGSVATPIVLTGDWQRIKLVTAPMPEPDLNAFGAVVVEWDGVDGATDIGEPFYVDATDIVVNQFIPLDIEHITGSLGNRFHWDGTPNESASYYIPESIPGYIPPGSVPGTNGTMQVSAELWASDATGFPLRDLTEHIIDGTVDMNVDRAIMMNLSMKVKDPEAIAPYADYLIPYFNISYQDGRPSERHQLGLWPTKLPASGEYTVNMATGTFQCDDMVSVAINAFSDAVVTQPDTTRITDAVYSRLAQAGVIKRDIPTDSTTFGVSVSRPAGTSWGALCNEWLTGLGWYTLHMRLDGYVTTSGAYRDLDQVEPSVVLTDTDMLAPLVPVPSENQVVNIAVVTTETNVIPPLVGIARNDTQSSPASTVHIGPRYKYETMPSPTTQAKINKRARLIVQDGRRYYRTVTAQIPPMPQLLEPRQVVELQLTGKQADLSGRWYVRTARMGLTPETAPMTLELNQTVTFDGTVI